MRTEDTMVELFAAEVERLGQQQGLTTEERARICEAFRRMLADPLLDDRTIFRLLVGDARVP